MMFYQSIEPILSAGTLPDSGLHIIPFRHTKREYEALAKITLETYPEWATQPDNLKFQDRSRPEYCKHRRWLVADNDEIVGFASYSNLVWAYNPHHFVINIGLARRCSNQDWHALHDMLVRKLHAFEPTRLISWTFEDRPAIVAALQRLGYRQEMQYANSELDVETVGNDRFKALRASFDARGYRVETAHRLANSDPDFEAKLYDLAMEIDGDMPMSLPFTPPTFEVWRKYALESRSYMPDAFFVALDGEHYIGLSTLRGPSVDPDRLHVGSTGVRRAYRRQGVATCLKLLTIDFAQRAGVRFIRTDNEENNPMFQINLGLGFTPLPSELEYHRNL